MWASSSNHQKDADKQEAWGMHDWAKVLFYASCSLNYNIVIFSIIVLSLTNAGITSKNVKLKKKVKLKGSKK
jgi:hypothetical protein